MAPSRPGGSCPGAVCGSAGGWHLPGECAQRMPGEFGQARFCKDQGPTQLPQDAGTARAPEGSRAPGTPEGASILPWGRPRSLRASASGLVPDPTSACSLGSAPIVEGVTFDAWLCFQEGKLFGLRHSGVWGGAGLRSGLSSCMNRLGEDTGGCIGQPWAGGPAAALGEGEEGAHLGTVFTVWGGMLNSPSRPGHYESAHQLLLINSETQNPLGSFGEWDARPHTQRFWFDWPGTRLGHWSSNQTVPFGPCGARASGHSRVAKPSQDGSRSPQAGEISGGRALPRGLAVGGTVLPARVSGVKSSELLGPAPGDSARARPFSVQPGGHPWQGGSTVLEGRQVKGQRRANLV